MCHRSSMANHRQIVDRIGCIQNVSSTLLIRCSYAVVARDDFVFEFEGQYYYAQKWPPTCWSSYLAIAAGSALFNMQ